MPELHDVVIVGAGTTGAAAAYHLAQAGVEDILCLEMGAVGQGRTAADRRCLKGGPRGRARSR